MGDISLELVQLVWGPQCIACECKTCRWVRSQVLDPDALLEVPDGK